MRRTNLNIAVSADTKTLTAKLRAISYHSEALADELERIDKDICPECGEFLESVNIYADSKPCIHYKICNECGYKEEFEENE